MYENIPQFPNEEVSMTGPKRESEKQLKKINDHKINEQAREYDHSRTSARHGRPPGGYKHTEGRGFKE